MVNFFQAYNSFSRQCEIESKRNDPKLIDWGNFGSYWKIFIGLKTPRVEYVSISALGINITLTLSHCSGYFGDINNACYWVIFIPWGISLIKVLNYVSQWNWLWILRIWKQADVDLPELFNWISKDLMPIYCWDRSTITPTRPNLLFLKAVSKT